MVLELLGRLVHCEKAIFLISQSLDKKLSLRERTILRWHLIVCEECSQYAQELELIQGLLRIHHQGVEEPDSANLPARLSEEARQRIKKLLAEQLKKR
jgi:putative zinc finger protein